MHRHDACMHGYGQEYNAVRAQVCGGVHGAGGHIDGAAGQHAGPGAHLHHGRPRAPHPPLLGQGLPALRHPPRRPGHHGRRLRSNPAPPCLPMLAVHVLLHPLPLQRCPCCVNHGALPLGLAVRGCPTCGLEFHYCCSPSPLPLSLDDIIDVGPQQQQGCSDEGCAVRLQRLLASSQTCPSSPTWCLSVGPLPISYKRVLQASAHCMYTLAYSTQYCHGPDRSGRAQMWKRGAVPCPAGTLYAFLNVAAGLIFYRLYDPKVSTRADFIKVLAHLLAICGASVGAQTCHAFFALYALHSSPGPAAIGLLQLHNMMSGQHMFRLHCGTPAYPWKIFCREVACDAVCRPSHLLQCVQRLVRHCSLHHCVVPCNS